MEVSMRRPALCAAFVILSAYALSAEGSDSGRDLISPTVEFPSSIGVFGSTMLDGGLSWQRWMGDIGFAVTAGGTARLQTDNEGGVAAPVPDYYTWSYNAELDLMYRLFSSNSWNWLSGDLFVYLQLGHQGGQYADYLSGDIDADPATTDDIWWKSVPSPFIARYSVGLSVGYEIVLFRHFSLPLYFGYTAQYPLALDFNFGGGLRYRY